MLQALLVLGVILGVILLMLASVEAYARLVVGLGDPPLWKADPEMEYLAVPSKRYRRFGNRVSYNAYSMRSRDFPAAKSDAAERRVLIVGDSVINGGAETDQNDLATTLLERDLAEALHQPVVVGNASAGSWGPPNCLAYLKRFGFMDADVLVVVVNSRDYADAPTFPRLDARRPQRRPLLALQELWGKYLRRYLHKRRRIRSGRTGPPPVKPEDVKWCLDSLREIVGLARDAGCAVILAQFMSKPEIEGEPETGHHEFRRVADELGLEPVQLGPAFAEALGSGDSPYRGPGHPNALGQRLMARTLLAPILDRLAPGRTAAGGPT